MRFLIKKSLHFNNETVRHEWVIRQLSELPDGSRILDAGCGDQVYREFASHLEYKAQDFARYDGKGDDSGLQIKDFKYGELDYTGNIWTIDAADATFDAILCTEVIEHIPYPNEALAELSRLLKPGGILILTAPFSSIPHMSPFYFFSGYHPNWYRKILGENDMEVIEISENGSAFAYVGQELLRLRKAVKNPIAKAVFIIASLPLIIILKFFHATIPDRALYLPFGYHVLARRINS